MLLKTESMQSGIFLYKCMTIFLQSCLYVFEVNTLMNSPRYVDHQNNIEHDEEVVSVPEYLVA